MKRVRKIKSIIITSENGISVPEQHDVAVARRGVEEKAATIHASLLPSISDLRRLSRHVYIYESVQKQNRRPELWWFIFRFDLIWFISFDLRRAWAYDGRNWCSTATSPESATDRYKTPSRHHWIPRPKFRLKTKQIKKMWFLRPWNSDL